MPFSLPLSGTPARDMLGDLAHVVEVLDPANIARLPWFDDALRSARRNFPEGAKSVAMICLRADDERWLISVGPRGGWKRLWNFGTGRA